MIEADPTLTADGADAAAEEVKRRRRVIRRTAFAAVPLLALGALRLAAVGRERRPSKYCDIDFSLLTSDSPPEGGSTGRIPCEFETVTVVASWQWPAVIAVVLLRVGFSAALWLLQPRMVRADPANERGARSPLQADRTPLVGKPVRSGTRLKLTRFTSILMWVLSLVFTGAGAALLSLPSGAPPVISLMLIMIGVGSFRSRHLGTIEADSERLRVGRTLRWTSWNWSDIESVEALDVALGNFGSMRSALVVTERNGHVFTHEEVSSRVSRNGLSRAERAVLALVPYGGARIKTSR